MKPKPINKIFFIFLVFSLILPGFHSGFLLAAPAHPESAPDTLNSDNSFSISVESNPLNFSSAFGVFQKNIQILSQVQPAENLYFANGAAGVQMAAGLSADNIASVRVAQGSQISMQSKIAIVSATKNINIQIKRAVQNPSSISRYTLRQGSDEPQQLAILNLNSTGNLRFAELFFRNFDSLNKNKTNLLAVVSAKPTFNLRC